MRDQLRVDPYMDTPAQFDTPAAAGQKQPLSLTLGRSNLVHKKGEAWRPPVFASSEGLLGRLEAAMRRFVDFQAGSIWRDLRRLLPHARGGVLDVGCGAQPYRTLLSRDTTYLGIDSIHAKDHFGYSLPDVLYFEGDEWPVGNDASNFILCTETLEHVSDPDILLREAFRCLAPGGTLLLTVPFAARWHFIPHDYWRFTATSLDLLLRRAGFSNVRVYARGNAVTVMCYKVMALLLRLALPQNPRWISRAVLQVLSLPLAPVMIVTAAVAQVSLRGDGGDDCLGYTVLADKAAR